jgi:hypothetical protein
MTVLAHSIGGVQTLPQADIEYWITPRDTSTRTRGSAGGDTGIKGQFNYLKSLVRESGPMI